uniref:Transmembrane protein adipocyte-associated 1 homolog n=1 Tax=Trichuris muris TaxID=70415 RepID=A0A5S6R2Y4_TRIMR
MDDVTEVWPLNSSTGFTGRSFATANESAAAVCKLVFTSEFSANSVRIWDAIIFLPNVLFLLFLISKFSRIRAKLAATRSPVYLTFYVLVYISALVNVVRSVVAMIVSGANLNGRVVEKSLWLILQFFLFSLEIIVLVFGLFLGRLDSKTSIKRALVVAAVICGLYSIAQATLEFGQDDAYFQTQSQRIVIYSHGSSLFLLVSSALLALAYLGVSVLPVIPFQRVLLTPRKRSFYFYCTFLFGIYALQVIASILLLLANLSGLCVLAIPLYIYYTCFVPGVYITFLRGFVTMESSDLLFSYSHQKDFFDDVVDHEASVQSPSHSMYAGSHFPTPFLSTDESISPSVA